MDIKERGIVAELWECRASLAQLRERAARVGSLARSVLAEAEAEEAETSSSP